MKIRWRSRGLPMLVSDGLYCRWDCRIIIITIREGCPDILTASGNSTRSPSRRGPRCSPSPSCRASYCWSSSCCAGSCSTGTSNTTTWWTSSGGSSTSPRRSTGCWGPSTGSSRTGGRSTRAGPGQKIGTETRCLWGGVRGTRPAWWEAAIKTNDWCINNHRTTVIREYLIACCHLLLTYDKLLNLRIKTLSSRSSRILLLLSISTYIAADIRKVLIAEVLSLTTHRISQLWWCQASCSRPSQASPDRSMRARLEAYCRGLAPRPTNARDGRLQAWTRRIVVMWLCSVVREGLRK